MLAPLLFVFGVFLWRIMETKRCSNCKLYLPLSDFSKNRSCKDGYHHECKNCNRKTQLKYREKNRQREKDRTKEYVIKNQDKVKKSRKIYYKNHIEKILEDKKNYYLKNRENIIQKNSNYTHENKEKVNQYRKIYFQNRKQKDEVFLFSTKIRNVISQSFRRSEFVKNKHTEEILGCSIKDLKIHLYNTFFNNYGYEYDGTEKVHIDHIIPLATAKTVEDVENLCHYTNLQLLRAEDNLKKGSKTDYEI